MMIGKYEKTVMKAVSLCFKPWLKPEEAMIYCNLGHTQFNKKCTEFGIHKNTSGYFSKTDLDKMLSGERSVTETKADQLKFKFNKK